MNNEITQETTASSSTAVTEDLISEAVVIPVSPTPEECPVADEQREVLKINETSASRQAPEMPSAVVEDTKHVITIPKKRGRKPRFRNLHEPELLEKVVASTTTKKEIVESSISNNVDLRTMQDAAEYNIKVQPISGAEVISSRTAHIPIQRSEHQYFEKNALTKSAESEEYEAQIAPNVDAIKTTEYEEEKKSTTTEHQLLPLDVITTQQSDLEIEEEKKSKSNDVNSGLEIEVVDHQIVTDARSSHAELKEESKSLSTLLMNEITERDIDMIEKKDDSFSLTLNDNCQTIRPELDTNVIHQVDIETNMLLDILRQVQTNTEANELRVKNKTYTGAITEALSNEKVSSNEGKPASCNLWKKVDTDSTSSNSSSIRSETASPLTFKKVIRRCDRRNRRSEESTNKTLEETFAEITALSSKITLEVTASDLAEEKKDMVDAGEDVSKGNAEAAEEESLIGETKKEKEKILTTAAEENLIVSLEKPKSQEAKVAIGLSTSPVGNENNVTKFSNQKRDLSANRKQDVKNSVKKQSKKLKSNQEDVLLLTNEDSTSKSSKSSSSAPKRGRKPKNQSHSLTEQRTTASAINSGKRKGKKDAKVTSVEDIKKPNVYPESYEDSQKDVDVQNCGATADKMLDEKSAKRKRQKRLKKDFEAALIDDFNNKESLTLLLGLNESTYSVSSTKITKEPLHTETIRETISVSTVCNAATPDTEEDPDPLKDIEKFIEAGVNLLKKDYKIDEDSMDGCIPNKSVNKETVAGDVEKVFTESALQTVSKITQEYTEVTNVVNTFETPVDTPIATPSATPPPKSPINNDAFTTPDVEEIFGVRRSHRIKQITKAPKALVGRGLVRDRERFSIKDDVETKSHYTLDDHLTDLAEVEAKNAKFLKEMEERLSNFQVIKENEYKCERVISREARKMICDCFLTAEEEERGELGCGEDCLNRLLMIECGPDCNVKERCTNKRFQKFSCSPCRVFPTEKKGFGIMADIELLPGEFIMQYVGEVIDSEEFENRRLTYSRDKNRHYYFMALRSDAIIDATIKGNISRFINHSCDPNAETQKWTVNGELRIGFFSRKSIMPGEEITFDYQYQRYGREAQRCYCESANCRGWIGQEPTSDEGEQIDEESDEEEEEESSHLLVPDDDDEDDDSDTSIADPEEVQKKLEMAAAQAEAELGSITIEENEVKGNEKSNLDDIDKKEEKGDSGKASQTEIEIEDSKSKFKKLLSKMAEKVAAKQKQNKRQQKLERKRKTENATRELGSNKQRFLEDPDIEDE
uniref:[histone H3]-lysine(36) N-trimethyltransferase n=1 Tax=Glossina pallidipes TaxID=7398 RepID=A0A1B0A7P2_GLOPL